MNELAKLMSNTLMYYFVILIIKVVSMNSVHFEHSPNHKYPAIELDMSNFVEQLSDKYTSHKADIKEVQINPNPIECQTDGYTSVAEISSITKMGFEREEKVKRLM